MHLAAVPAVRADDEPGPIVLVLVLDGLRPDHLGCYGYRGATSPLLDELWSALTADGGEEGPCGWLKDKYGLSWQIDSRALHEMIVSPDQEAAARATKAMFTMRKLDVQALQDAFDGKS